MTNWLSKKAMLASLNISQWGARRLDKTITDEVNESHGAAHDAGRYNKLLVNKIALAPIQSIVGSARIYHLTHTQPWFDLGARLLPAALYFEYTAKMKKLRSDFECEADNFARDYPQHVELRKRELGDLFCEKDYPLPSRVRSLFSFDAGVMPVQDPHDFRVELASDHADDIKHDIEKRVNEAIEGAMKEPVERIVETVGHMAARLRAYKPAVKARNEKGQMRVIEEAESTFRDSLVENVRSLADLLPAFNLTGDKTITTLANRIKSELCFEDAETLREAHETRAVVAQSAESILELAKQLIS